MIRSALLLSTSVAVAAIAAAACGGGGGTPTNPTNPPASASTTTTAPPPATTTAPPAASADAGAPAPAGDGGAAAQSAFAAQVAAGNTLYQKYCAECHDSDGTGISAPAVVGLTHGALPTAPPSDAKERKTRFVTWFDVGDFIQKAMPPADKKVKLHDDETWAITAWIAQKNGFDLGSQTFDANTAKTVQIRK